MVAARWSGTRVLLFDIDGTLVDSRGSGRRALGAALSQVVGRPLDVTAHPMAGKTDTQICREILAAEGVAPEGVGAAMAAALDLYESLLADEMRQNLSRWRILPGVADLLVALSNRPGVGLGLLTGNVRSGARIKLSKGGLGRFFPFGAFGDDSEDRNDLGPIAIERARAHLGGRAIDGAVVIGDTPADIACGRACGARVIGVATGRYGLDELSGADRTFATLEATGALLEVLLG